MKKEREKTHEAPDGLGAIEPRRTLEPVEACEGISMALAAAAKVVARAAREGDREREREGDEEGSEKKRSRSR